MIGWFRKWWPWGRKEVSGEARASYRLTLFLELAELKKRHDKAVAAKKKRSHIEARMKEIRTELLRMEAGK